jgi:hypothetical protein
VTAAEQPGDARQLHEEIEQTREHLGATVEQLAAKADVKGRAQAKAAELGRQVTWQARGVVAQAQRLGVQARKQAAEGAGAARKHRVPLSAAAAGVLLAAVAFIIWQRSTR